jgi:hypothetical protein
MAPELIQNFLSNKKKAFFNESSDIYSAIITFYVVFMDIKDKSFTLSEKIIEEKEEFQLNKYYKNIGIVIFFI